MNESYTFSFEITFTAQACWLKNPACTSSSISIAIAVASFLPSWLPSSKSFLISNQWITFFKDHNLNVFFIYIVYHRAEPSRAVYRSRRLIRTVRTQKRRALHSVWGGVSKQFWNKLHFCSWKFTGIPNKKRNWTDFVSWIQLAIFKQSVV